LFGVYLSVWLAKTILKIFASLVKPLASVALTLKVYLPPGPAGRLFGIVPLIVVTRGFCSVALLGLFIFGVLNVKPKPSKVL